jgi:hypothetical protein
VKKAGTTEGSEAVGGSSGSSQLGSGGGSTEMISDGRSNANGTVPFESDPGCTSRLHA